MPITKHSVNKLIMSIRHNNNLRAQSNAFYTGFLSQVSYINECKERKNYVLRVASSGVSPTTATKANTVEDLANSRANGQGIAALISGAVKCDG